MAVQITHYKVSWINREKSLQFDWFANLDKALSLTETLSEESDWVLTKHEITTLAWASEAKEKSSK